jgi:pyrroloquinoline quinone (PQQ) biosynthesis protein C
MISTAEWLNRASAYKLSFALQEYRYLVHRFSQWLALVVARASDARIRGLLLPNLFEEIGVPPEVSHLSLLDSCITSCGIRVDPVRRATGATREIEQWFVGACANENLLAGLAVLGPGTEMVSQSFLSPLEAALRRVYGERRVDFAYFDHHRPEVESGHAQAVDEAIRILCEASGDRGACEAERDFWAGKAIERHRQFWEAVQAGAPKAKKHDRL